LDIESRKPVEKNTDIRFYSNGIAFAGVAVMILCEEGLLRRNMMPEND
jgi:CubicO group peptidase (beta-lactamase class C family)